jgi:hypothetical protein
MHSTASETVLILDKSIAYTAFAAGTMTDVGIAIIMCWLLARARTGHINTDGVISAIMIYTVNSGMITA